MEGGRIEEDNIWARRIVCKVSDTGTNASPWDADNALLTSVLIKKY